MKVEVPTAKDNGVPEMEPLVLNDSPAGNEPPVMV
jgi:hypothetical protein